jgi:ABC-type branched-subunit amino acid transport system ATPase component
MTCGNACIPIAIARLLPSFSATRTGELIHRVTVDVRLFEDNAVELFSDLPFVLLTVIGVLTMEASHAEIEEAARKSGVEQLVQRFPHGLETMVGERGATLSGGERHHQPYQCIASAG